MKIVVIIILCLIILRISISLFIYFSPDPCHYYSNLFTTLGIIDPENNEWIKIITGPTAIPCTSFYYIEFELSPSLSLADIKQHQFTLADTLNAQAIYLEKTRDLKFLLIYSLQRPSYHLF